MNVGQHTMVRTVFFILLVFSFSLASAEPSEFIREYTYQASESDSKVSARKSAIQQLQTLVIQETGVSVQTTVENSETLINGEYSQNQKTSYQAKAKAYAKTDVLEEKWDGETFYIKAKVTVIRDSLRKAQSENCEEQLKTISKQLIDIKTPSTHEALMELSMRNSFEGHCNKWQFDLINTLREKEIFTDRYRAYLFTSIGNAGINSQGKLINATIMYAARSKPITKDEFMLIVKAVQGLSHKDIAWVIDALIEVTVRDLPAGTPQHIKDQNERKQWISMLDWQVSEFYYLAKQDLLGKPTSMTLSDTLAVYLEKIISRNSGNFESTYFLHHHLLDDKGNIGLSKKFSRYVKRNLSQNSFELLDFYIKDAPIDPKSNTDIVKLLNTIRSKGKKEPYYLEALNKLIDDNRTKVGDIIAYSRISKKKKNDWFDTYKLGSK